MRSGRVRLLPLGVMSAVALGSLALSVLPEVQFEGPSLVRIEASEGTSQIIRRSPAIDMAVPAPVAAAAQPVAKPAAPSRPGPATLEPPVPGDDGLVIAAAQAFVPSSDGQHAIEVAPVVATLESSMLAESGVRRRPNAAETKPDRGSKDTSSPVAAGSPTGALPTPPPSPTVTASSVASSTPAANTATATVTVGAGATATETPVPATATAVPATATAAPATATATPTQDVSALKTSTPTFGLPPNETMTPIIPTTTPAGSPVLTLALVGSVPGDAYSVRGVIAGTSASVRIEFEVNGNPDFHLENFAPYYLFGDDGSAPALGSLGPGAHAITARAFESGTETLVATSSTLTVIDAPDTATTTPVAATSTPATAASSTPTPTSTRTNTPVPGATNTPTSPATQTPTPAATSTRTPTPTSTRTSTATPTRTPTAAPPPTATPTTPPVSGTRDKFKQPFASTSFWNMPLGSGAAYRSSPIRSRIGIYWTDEDPIVMGGSVLRDAWENGDWPISGRVGGRKLPYQVPVPSGLTTHSATDIGNQANFSGAFLKSDGRTVVEAQGLVIRSSAVTMMIERSSHDIYGDGYPAIGGHGGSALSGVGGSIRVWEAQGDAPITHAIKTLISDLDLSATSGGYRWPARNADYGYAGRYVGSNSDLRMGALLALNPSVNINALGLTTDFGKRVAWTVQNYGMYVVDELYGSWDPITLTVEYGVNEALAARYGSTLEGGPIAADMARIWAQLSIVTNNGPGSIGGGGTPRQPLAPPIGN